MQVRIKSGKIVTTREEYKAIKKLDRGDLVKFLQGISNPWKRQKG